MADTQKVHIAHMKAAYSYAELSSCVRKQVGAIIVNGESIIDFGYNGTPPKWDNCCEDKIYFEGEMSKKDTRQAGAIAIEFPLEDDGGRYKLISKPEVRHAEQNAFYKIGKSTRSADGATLYVTMQPCRGCAEDIIGHNIKEVFYCEDYRLTDGIDYLRQHGIPVTQIKV